MITLDGTLGITSPGGDSNATLVSTGNHTAAAYIPSGSSAPTNGLYLPAANTLAISSNSTKVLSVIKGSSLALEGATPQVGTGISFPATQVASSDVNTLDDYEEGTFTATLKGTVADPTTPVTTTARYTKIGNMVSINIGYDNVNTTGASGAITVIGLPFTNASGGVRTVGSVNSYSLATWSGYLTADLPTNSTTISMLGVVSNSAWAAATHSAGSGRYMMIAMSYTT